MSLWAVLLTGVFAGGASRAAVQGGLLAGVVARRAPEPVPAPQKRKRGKPLTPPQPPPRSFRDDAAPVGAFLGGKLASHLLLGPSSARSATRCSSASRPGRSCRSSLAS